jgi:hypothetical protein
MNTDQGTFVALSANTSRVGIITYGMGSNRTILWLDDYSFQNVHFKDLIEAKKPARRTQKFYKYDEDSPRRLSLCPEDEAQYVGVVSDIPVPCSSCPAKSADCVSGQLRGAQSCVDTRTRFEKK